VRVVNLHIEEEGNFLAEYTLPWVATDATHTFYLIRTIVTDRVLRFFASFSTFFAFPETVLPAC
jgi:hypothetical protein